MSVKSFYKQYNYIPNISGFADFISWHGNGKPIYLVNGHLVPDFCLECNINYFFNFWFDCKEEIEKAIQENLYMFDIKESDDFYYPNTNMFSMSNAEYGIKGLILTLKKQYRNPENRY